jgi:hypothetical protein
MNLRKRLRILGVLVAAALGLLVVALPGSASARDRNHDRLPDRWERQHHLSLHKNQARRDQDRDRLVNRQEFKARTNPRDADSDDDGIPDDQENAGTIASFDGTTLTINLFNGSSLSGIVAEGTEIKCEGPGDDNDQGDDDNSGSGGGDDDSSGPGGGDDDASSQAAMTTSDDDDDNGGDDQGDEGDECTTADLVPDTVVKEADLELANGQATFEEVELVK